MSDKQVGRTIRVKATDPAEGQAIPHQPHDQAEMSDVPEAVHGSKEELLARFRAREERDRAGESPGVATDETPAPDGEAD